MEKPSQESLRKNLGTVALITALGAGSFALQKAASLYGDAATRAHLNEMRVACDESEKHKLESAAAFLVENREKMLRWYKVFCSATEALDCHGDQDLGKYLTVDPTIHVYCPKDQSVEPGVSGITIDYRDGTHTGAYAVFPMAFRPPENTIDPDPICSLANTMVHEQIHVLRGTGHKHTPGKNDWTTSVSVVFSMACWDTLNGDPHADEGQRMNTASDQLYIRVQRQSGGKD